MSDHVLARTIVLMLNAINSMLIERDTLPIIKTTKGRMPAPEGAGGSTNVS